jgi:hypothetical protein
MSEGFYKRKGPGSGLFSVYTHNIIWILRNITGA